MRYRIVTGQEREDEKGITLLPERGSTVTPGDFSLEINCLHGQSTQVNKLVKMLIEPTVWFY